MSIFAPLVSIVIPCYNGESFIARSIDSCLSQNYENIEIIVVDDGSTDKSKKIIKAYGSKVMLYCQANKGACAARNFGLKHSSGEYIKFLDADDFLFPGAVSKQIKNLNKIRDDTVIQYGFRTIKREGEEREREVFQDVVKSKNQVVDLITRNIITTLPLYPRRLLEDVGGFNDMLHARHEWDLNLRLAYHGYKFSFDGVRVYCQFVHHSPHRISSRKLEPEKEKSNLDNIFKTHCDFLDSNGLAAWSWKYWNLGRQFLKMGNTNAAEIFFKQAKEISPDGYKKFWPLSYKVATTFLGTELSERLYKHFRFLGF